MDSLPCETPGKPQNTGVVGLSLLQGIFRIQELNQGFLHCRQVLYQLSYQGSLSEERLFLPGLESSGQTSFTLQEGSPAHPNPSPLSPSFLSGCFEGEKNSQELGPSSAGTVRQGGDRRGISGSDPAESPGEVVADRAHSCFRTPTPVLQILLQPVPRHLRCPQHGRGCCVLEPLPYQGLHVLQLRLDSEDMGPHHQVRGLPSLRLHPGQGPVGFWHHEPSVLSAFRPSPLQDPDVHL